MEVSLGARPPPPTPGISAKSSCFEDSSEGSHVTSDLRRTSCGGSSWQRSFVRPMGAVGSPRFALSTTVHFQRTVFILSFEQYALSRRIFRQTRWHFTDADPRERRDVGGPFLFSFVAEAIWARIFMKEKLVEFRDGSPGECTTAKAWHAARPLH